MARTNNLTNFLTDVSSAIKQKTGDNTPIPASDFDTEILSIETAGNYQSKTLNVTQNGNYNLLPDQDYDAMSNVNISVNVPTGEDLDAVITAQEQKLTQLETILQSKASGGGGSEPNIFVQLEEPTIKKGIWLQKEAEPEYYTYEDNIFISGQWATNSTYTDIPYAHINGTSVNIGTNIYLFGSDSNDYTRYAYVYDTLNNIYYRLPDIPGNDNTNGMRSTVIGTDIYLFGGGNGSGQYRHAYKYDTLTNTYTQLTNVPFEFCNMLSIAVGTNIYLISGAFYWNDYSRQCYKYNTLTDTYTRLNDSPIVMSAVSGTKIGNYIYIFGGNSSDVSNVYRYDISTDTYFQLTNIPYRFAGGRVISVGTDIYIFGSGNNNYNQYMYKYDTLTDTYTRLTDIPFGFNNGSVNIINDNIYLFGGKVNPTKVQSYVLQSKNYQQNNLVIVNQLNNNIGYDIELYSNNKNVIPPKYNFSDAFYYTTQDGLDATIPTYYGDGTQWINIKNQPSHIPGEYVELEYIESTGTQYIDTGLSSIDKSIAIDIKFSISQSKNFQALFCCRSSNENTRISFVKSLDGFRNDQNSEQRDISESLSLNTLYELQSTQTEFILNNIQLTTYPSGSGSDISRALVLLNSYDISTGAMSDKYQFVGKLYGCKIYENNMLVRDFIPVISEYNVICLYDKVTNMYFYNMGTGSFIAGPEKEVEE